MDPEQKYPPDGRHWLVDLFDCDPRRLDAATELRNLLRRSAEAAGARVVADVFHAFAPHGVTGVVVVEESHFSIHTWPERGYAALDFYTCGSVAPEQALRWVAEAVQAQRIESLEISRSMDPERTLRVLSRPKL